MYVYALVEIKRANENQRWAKYGQNGAQGSPEEPQL